MSSEQAEAPELDAEQFQRIFFPRAAREMDRIRDNNVRFVHYTSADAGMKILRSERMLLRNATLMNDFSEVEHGMKCLAAAYDGPQGERLKTLMRGIQPDLPEVLETHLNSLMEDIRHETYLIAISEHCDGLEDSLGRLSMWRAYGRQNGIAFVFNNAPFINNSDAQHSFSIPVGYDTPETFAGHFKEIVDAIENHIGLLTGFGGPWFQEMLVCVFRFAIQSTKHPAFSEEREWRVIYSPTLLLRNGQMTEEQLARIPTEVMSLGGVPQRVYAINFKDYPGKGASKVTVSALLDRVLIGPTQDAYAIAQAFIAELDLLGIEDAASKVVMTGVPLRQSAG